MLKGKNVVVTGANRGIGLEIVRCCAKNGANVFACIRDMCEANICTLNEIGDKNNVKIMVFELHAEDENSIKECASAILACKEPIDGIVNNIGITGGKNLFMMTAMKDIRMTFEVNFFGPMAFTQRLLKNMIRHRSGAIVNISSAAAFDGDPAQFEYVSSKAAIIGATRKLAIELGNYGISVNAIAPGVTQTDMISQMKDELLSENIGKTALKKIGEPADVANMVIFLLSDRCGYITGQTIRVDGGLH